jgi:hypothetical protein
VLTLAVIKGSIPLIEYLIEKGAEINIEDLPGVNVLFLLKALWISIYNIHVTLLEHGSVYSAA